MGSPTNYPRPHLDPANGPPCPRCGSQATKEVKYTWWGGILGPRLLNISKCYSCGCQFNRKTGKDVLRAIILYNVIGLLIGAVIILAVAGTLHR